MSSGPRVRWKPSCSRGWILLVSSAVAAGAFMGAPWICRAYLMRQPERQDMRRMRRASQSPATAANLLSARCLGGSLRGTQQILALRDAAFLRQHAPRRASGVHRDLVHALAADAGLARDLSDRDVGVVQFEDLLG